MRHYLNPRDIRNALCGESVGETETWHIANHGGATCEPCRAARLGADPLSPQWEDCKVCGGDHWTKDHPADRTPPADHPQARWSDPSNPTVSINGVPIAEYIKRLENDIRELRGAEPGELARRLIERGWRG